MAAEAATSAPRRRSSRLAGHELWAEGKPYLSRICGCGSISMHIRRNEYDSVGHAVCTCGDIGPCQTTDSARKQWHRDHKNQVRTDTYCACDQPAHNDVGVRS